MTSETKRFPIVGIGASAGGIPAMKGFFEGLPEPLDMAFVIVTHLSPDRESMLHEIVDRYASLPVSVTQDGEALEPRHVYVMPPNAILSIEGGRFQIRRPNTLQRERKPIDIFFSALAKDQGEYAAGIVLSGGDGDGTLGVKAIKERGGLTLAQASDGSAPANPDMPNSAIGSGVIDLAVPVEDMGAKLMEFGRSFEVLEELENDSDAKGDEGLQKAQDEIYAILLSQAGHDFSGYKTRTFLRRVNRRMQVAQTATLGAYVERLRSDPEEVRSLFRDLLINVTNFFRDASAFEALAETVLPKLFEGKNASDTIRVWIPGCATGEEVYSISILMREHMATLSVAPRVQIFATDIDDAALAVARSGRYPEALMEGVSPERRDRFFTSDGASYVVRKDVREMCIFSPHSVIRDPPFSRMDLVSCRNLLIYFGGDIQDQVIPTFHYALKPGGYLFLGTSESISKHAELFATVEKKYRIFRAREKHHQPPRLPLPFGPRVSRSSEVTTSHYSGSSSFPLRHTVEAHVLERFAPAHVVVDRDGNVVYYSARTGRFLEPPQGVPNRQLMAMARKGLRLELRAALHEAVEHSRTVTRDNIAIDEGDDQIQQISLTIEPLPQKGQSDQLFVVLFTPVGPVQSRSEAEHRQFQDRDGAVALLEQELRDTRERLQATIEEYETALEELKSSNEELVSVNEESQSSNEELEASKEEMQSLNEELNTINAELSAKVEELDQANNDLRNLFESTKIATVFLDRNLVIRNFTPAASGFFNLLPADVGRPLTDLASHLDYPELKAHIRQVFDSGETIEHRTARESGTFLVRLHPYRDGDGSIEGVVVTFVDVSNLVEAEEHQKVLVGELNHRVKNMLAVVMSIISQTAKRSKTKDEFAEAVMGRMASMARAYGSLSRDDWKMAQLDEVIRHELKPFGLHRIVLSGGALEVPPQHGLSIGMIVHELATNAAKYGALASCDGRLEVAWSAEDQAGKRRFRFEWREKDGPVVEKPEKFGFGLRLIRAECERHGGAMKADFRPEGLHLTLECRLQE